MTDLKAALEAVLFAAGESVPVGRLSLVFAVEQDEALALCGIHVSFLGIGLGQLAEQLVEGRGILEEEE